MTRQIPHVKAGDRADVVREILDDVGAVVVEGILDESQIERIGRDLEPFVDTADPNMEHLNWGLQIFFSGVRNVTGLTSKSPAFVESLLLHPLLLGVADAFFAPTCSSYLLNVAHLLVREPGTRRQLLHRDEDVWVHLQQLLRCVEPHPEIELASITALCDFTEENGATAVVPGSHRWQRERYPAEHEIVHAEMPAGSSIIYRGSVIHAGGTNDSDLSRPAIHMSFVVGWLRTEEANLLSTPPDVARGLPRRAQELVGYRVHDAIEQAGGYAGAVDMQDPIDLVADGRL